MAIQVETLLLPWITVKKLSTDMKLVKGNLTVEQLRCTVAEGDLDGSVKLIPRAKDVEIRLDTTMQHLKVGTLLRELAIKQVIDGPADLGLKAVARGHSVAALMAGLTGKIFVVMDTGRVNKTYLGILGSELGTSLLRLINPLKQESDVAQLNCLVAGFDITNGLATANALLLDSTQVNVVGSGTINLRAETLNLSLKPSPRGTTGTEGIGKIALGLSELAKTFKLGGTLARPALAIDQTQAVNTLGKAIGDSLLFGPEGIFSGLAGRGQPNDKKKQPVDKNSCDAAQKRAKRGF